MSALLCIAGLFLCDYFNVYLIAIISIFQPPPNNVNLTIFRQINLTIDKELLYACYRYLIHMLHTLQNVQYKLPSVKVFPPFKKFIHHVNKSRISNT